MESQRVVREVLRKKEKAKGRTLYPNGDRYEGKYFNGKKSGRGRVFKQRISISKE